MEMTGIQDAGVDKIHFGYSGVAKKGEPHTYRIQGPTFLIDFNCEQTDSLNNPGNHHPLRLPRSDAGLRPAFDREEVVEPTRMRSKT